MREVGPALSTSMGFAVAGGMDNPIDDPQDLSSFIQQDPRAHQGVAGVRSAKSVFAPGLEAGLNLGLGAGLPMPRGRQLTRARWSHVDQHPPAGFPDRRGAVPLPSTTR